MGATNNFICANFILGQANLSIPGYTIERWHTVLVGYLIALICTAVNIYGPHLLDRLSRGLLVWNILSFVIVIVVILATNDHKQPASFVFKDFQNFTGFGTAYTAILGLLQSAFGMVCFDTPSKMTEEMKNASREAPKAIVLSVYLGAVTGFIFLISVCFCIGDIQSTALSPTGVPLIQIFYDSTQSFVGTCFLSSLIVVIGLGSANSLLAEGSRALYAFARDHGLPFSPVFSKVEPKKQVPVYAILLACGVQLCMNSIYFGTLTGFSTVISMATEGFCKPILFPFPILSSLTRDRPLLRHAPPRPYPRPFLRLCQSSLRALGSGQVRYLPEYNRLHLPTLHIHYLQFPNHQSRQPNQYELHLCRHRHHRADQHRNMDHDREEALHGTADGQRKC